jgi:hypothetical protein
MNGIANILGRIGSLLVIASVGCAEQQTPPSNDTNRSSPSAQIDAEQVQTRVMGFADRYMTAMAAVYEEAQLSTTMLDGRVMAQRCKVYAGTGAMGNAANPNPIVGLMDMAVMVTLSREIAEAPWSRELFGPKNAAAIVLTLKVEETEIWAVAELYLSPDQIGQLRQLAEQWRKEHPDQRFVSEARLADFPQAKKSNNNVNVTQLATGVFGLVRVNPFAGLDPAVQQFKESRVLAERAFFYSQHLPMLLSWQVDLLYSQMLDESQIRQLFADTTTVASSTTRVSAAAGQFAEAGAHFSQTLENFRLELPRQQSDLVNQVHALVASERQAALQQATTQVADLRTTTVEQLNSTLNKQQDALNQKLQGLTQNFINLTFAQLRSLVFIIAATVLVTILLYRIIAAKFFRRPGGQ